MEAGKRATGIARFPDVRPVAAADDEGPSAGGVEDTEIEVLDAGDALAPDAAVPSTMPPVERREFTANALSAALANLGNHMPASVFQELFRTSATNCIGGDGSSVGGSSKG